MYAVIKTGGKQYKVAKDQKVKIEKLPNEVGDKVTFDEVLMVADGDKFKVGQPVVKGSKVTAEVVAQGRADKVNIVKFKRRKHYRKQQGHRQYFTEVKVTDIQ